MKARPAGLALQPALFAGVEGLSLLVGLLIQAWMMRTLGPPDYGGFALACALGIVATTLTDFGFNYAGVARAIQVAGDDEAASRHFWAVQSVKAISGAVTVASAWVLAGLVGGEQATLIAWAMTVSATTAWCVPTWLFFSRQRMVGLAALVLLARLAGLAFMVLFVGGPEQRSLAIGLTLGAPLLAVPALLAGRTLRPHARPRWVGAVELRAVAHGGSGMLWLSTQGVVANALLQSLIYNLTSSATLGVFAAADRVRAGLQGLFLAFAGAAFPRFVQLQVEQQRDARATAWHLLRLQIGAAGVVALGVLAFAPQIAAVVLGPAFGDSVPVLRVLALALLSSTLITVLGVQLMLPQGLGRAYTWASLATLALQALALCVLAPRAQAVGAAWAVVLSEVVVAALMFRHLRRKGIV